MNTPSTSPTIRLARPNDYESVAALIHRSHTISFAPFASANWVHTRDIDTYRAKWREILAKPSTTAACFVAEMDDDIVGTVRVSTLESPKFDAQLNGMHVDPEKTGHGIGSLLMNKALEFISEQEFKRVKLGVIASNSGARRFYANHGWELVRELPDGIEGVPIAIYQLA